MIVPRFIAGFSGHRNLAQPQVVAAALEKIWLKFSANAKAGGGVLELYSSIAFGADTLAVETARAQKTPVHLILPKPVVRVANGTVNISEGFAADFWNNNASGSPQFCAADWQRSLKQIEDAQNAIDGGTLRLTTGSQQAPECYYDAGLAVLEACDVLVAVWDGAPARGVGGTAQMVEQARNVKRPLIIIDPNTGQITAEERLEQFAAQSDGSRLLIREVDQFCASCGPGSGSATETAEEIFHRLETCSREQAGQFRDYLVWIIKIHGAATLVAAIACILPHNTGFWRGTLAALAFAEFCMVMWALWQTRQLRKHHVHPRWMRTRFGGELVRAIRHSSGLLDPLHPLVACHDAKWRRFAVTLGLMIHRETPPPKHWGQARDEYVAKRLRSSRITEGQIRYFTEKQAQAEPHFEKTVRWGNRLTRTAAIFIFCALLYKTWAWFHGHNDPQTNVQTYAWTARDALGDIAFRLMPIALPLAAGVLISLRAALDSGRRKYRYRELAAFLKTSADHLQVLKTEASVRRAVAATEEVLLDELIEWHLAEQQNGAH